MAKAQRQAKAQAATTSESSSELQSATSQGALAAREGAAGKTAVAAPQPRGNAHAQAQLAANGPAQGGAQALGGGAPTDPDDPGFDGDLGSFLVRMERAFGASFQGVNIKGGDAGARGAASGAVATTVGNNIFLGDAFDGLPAAKQEQVLAHELAHVAQQTKGRDSAADPEADAHAASADALAGKQVAPVAAIGSGSSHNFGMEDVSAAWDATGGAVIGAVGEWAVEKINDVGMLLAFIGKFGEKAAKAAIDYLAAHKVEIVLSFLTVSPTTALLVYALGKIPTDRLVQFFKSIDPAAVAKVVGIAIAAGAVAVVALPLLALGVAAGPVLKLLGGPALMALWSHSPQRMKDILKNGLVKNWPIGLGMELEGGLGATFGYPIYVGGESFFSMSHATAGVFKLKRAGILKVAGDTGVGAGGFIGLGGKKEGGKGSGAGGGGLGIGAEAGAQAQAGVKMMVIQEFEFPVADDNAFMAFVLQALQLSEGATANLMMSLTNDLRKVRPESYNTSTKMEAKTYGEASAGASAGIRTGVGDSPNGASTWGRNDGAGNTGTADKWWQRWLQVGIFGKLSAEAGVGFEEKNGKWTQDAEGVRVPGEKIVEFYGEAQAAAQIAHNIPFVSKAIPSVNFAPGVGLRVRYTLTGAPGDKDPKIEGPTWQVYGKTGEDNFYQGAASETAVGMTSLDAANFKDLDTFLANVKGGVSVKRRFMVSTEIGRKYFNRADKQGAFTTMLPKEYKSMGFSVEGYLDLESKLTTDQIRSIFRAIATASSRYRQGSALAQLYTDVTTLLATGKGPPEVVAQLENIANILLAGVSKLDLHGVVSIGAAAGAQLSAGAKARLHLSGKAALTWDVSVLESVAKGGTVTVTDIMALLEGKTGGGAGALQVPGTGG
ncbi:hypothetical protein LBMAG42_32560 [Deltaproteobacteria bacterium]|nr:hypothetical protein LBMAG42_32560 [Deltaproteobacteria bacterium]